MSQFEAIDYFANLDLIDDPHPFFRHLFVLFVQLGAFGPLLLGILDKGVLTLGDNRKVDFSSTKQIGLPNGSLA